MPYLGNQAGNRFVASKAATQFSGDGSTTAFTLDHGVGSDEDILVSVDGVIQEPSVAYAVSNGTTLTFTAAPSSNSGNNIFVYYLFRTVATVDHPSTSSLQATDGTFSSALNVTGATTLTADLTVDTDTLKVDTTNDKVGINTASPSDYYSDELVVTAADEGGMTIVTGTTHANYINFADGTSGNAAYRGFLKYDHNIDKMTFGTSASSVIEVDSIGAVTKPLQPAFFVKLSDKQFNIPVNSDTAVEFDSEIFDQNSDFDTSNYTFTAPITGRYQFNVNLYLESVDSASAYVYTTLSTSNRPMYNIIDTARFSADLNYWTLTLSQFVDMDANDTCKINILQPLGTAQLDINATSFFSGFLVC